MGRPKGTTSYRAEPRSPGRKSLAYKGEGHEQHWRPLESRRETRMRTVQRAKCGGTLGRVSRVETWVCGLRASRGFLCLSRPAQPSAGAASRAPTPSPRPERAEPPAPGDGPAPASLGSPLRCLPRASRVISPVMSVPSVPGPASEGSSLK